MLTDSILSNKEDWEPVGYVGKLAPSSPVRDEPVGFTRYYSVDDFQQLNLGSSEDVSSALQDSGLLDGNLRFKGTLGDWEVKSKIAFCALIANKFGLDEKIAAACLYPSRFEKEITSFKKKLTDKESETLSELLEDQQILKMYGEFKKQLELLEQPESSHPLEAVQSTHQFPKFNEAKWIELGVKICKGELGSKGNVTAAKELLQTYNIRVSKQNASFYGNAIAGGLGGMAIVVGGITLSPLWQQA